MKNTNGREGKKEGNGIVPFAPPAPKNGVVEKPLSLILETLLFCLSLIPIIVYSIISKLFFSKPKSLTNKVVLITGTGRGLGQALAIEFAKCGCYVACADLNEKNNQETVNIINEMYPKRARGYTVNVAIPSSIRSLYDQVTSDFVNVDILVNNAGLVLAFPVLGDEVATINAILSVNVASHMFMVRQFLPSMKKRNEGHIVAISSMSALSALINGSAYSATKYAVNGYMEALDLELNELPGNKIRTSCVCPYFINTSETYAKYWKIRLPSLDVNDVAKEIVNGVRMNKKLFTIPNNMLIIMNFVRLLPDQAVTWFRNIFDCRLLPVDEKFRILTPTYKIVKDLESKDHNIEN